MPTNKATWCDNSRVYYQNDNILHQHTLHEEIRKEIEKISPATILDYGSGDGKLLAQYNTGKSYQVTLYDIDETALEFANGNYKDISKVQITSDENVLPKEHYDVVVCSNVLMCVPSADGVDAIFQKIKQVKHKDGVLLLGITHPCFVDREFSTFENDYTLNKKPFQYFENGDSYNVYIKKGDQTCTIYDYFWNLSFILKSAFKAGLEMIDFKEIEVVEKDYPAYLLIKFK